MIPDDDPTPMHNPSDPYRRTTHNPHYGAGGRPFELIATNGSEEVRESYWTRAEAEERRDALLDAGWSHVRILGLPTTLSGGG
jgi:hypothetical protein